MIAVNFRFFCVQALPQLLNLGLLKLGRVRQCQQVRQVDYVTDVLFQKFQHDLGERRVSDAVGKASLFVFVGSADKIGILLFTGGDGLFYHGPAALAAVHHAGEQVYRLAAFRGPGIQGKRLLDALKIITADDRLVTVLNDCPFLAGLVDQPLDPIAGGCHPALFQYAGVDRVFQYPQDHPGAPLGLFLDTEGCGVVHPLGLLIVHGSGNTGGT